MLDYVCIYVCSVINSIQDFVCNCNFFMPARKNAFMTVRMNKKNQEERQMALVRTGKKFQQLKSW